MPIRSYTVGQSNTVLRRDGHAGAWIDVSPTFAPAFNPRWYDVMCAPGTPDTVFIVGDIQQGVHGIMVSTDAGATWNLPSGNWATFGKQFYEVWAVDTSVIWVVGEGGATVKSTDGGLTFNNPDPFNPTAKPGNGLLEYTSAIHAIDASTAVVAGATTSILGINEAYVWKTIDGGNTWFDLNTGATYPLPVPPSLRNNQTDGVLTLSLTTPGTGYPPSTTILGLATTSSGSGVGCTVNINTDGGGAITTIAISTPGSGYAVSDTILPTGGTGVATIDSIGTGNPTGAPGGIWMSPDQQRIVVSTNYTQQLSTDGGLNFTAIPPETTRSGMHLTWYPSTAALPSKMRHVGGSIISLTESIDQGTSWSTERTDGATIKGAHFYSPQNGYYLVGNSIWSTSNGGVTGDVNLYTDALPIELEAVWTEEKSESSPCYRFTPCDAQVQPTIWTGAILTQYLGEVVNVQFGISPPILMVCGVFTEITEPPIAGDTDVCESAQEFSPQNQVLAVFTDCETCAGPVSTTPCYNLISCTPKTCPDILYATDPELAPFVGQYVEINGDNTCRYLVQTTRQAYYTGLNPTVLSNPVGDFQLGTDDHTLQVTSVVVNGTEYVPTPATPYVLTPVNYSVVECTELVCVSVAVDTTENCITNLPSYLNTVFANADVPELSAECADPAYCSDELNTALTKIQYSEGTSFSITFTVQSNVGTITYVYSGTAGNVTTLYIVSDVADSSDINIDTCNSQVQCTGHLAIDTTEPIINFTSCTPIPEIEIGEACIVRPRFAEPGFSTKYCNPQQVVDINCKYGDSVYALFKRMRYGIQTCCEYDLDKIEIKKDLMDLGALYDPDMCIPGQPVPFGCCPQPCDAIAEIEIPQFISCEEPEDAIAIIEVPFPFQPIICEEPAEVTSTLVVLTDPIPLCHAYDVTIPVSTPADTIEYTDCNGTPQVIAHPAVADAGTPLVYQFCALDGFPITTVGSVVQVNICNTECFSTLYEITIPASAFGSSYTIYYCNGPSATGFAPSAGVVFTICASSTEPPTFGAAGSWVNLGQCP